MKTTLLRRAALAFAMASAFAGAPSHAAAATDFVTASALNETLPLLKNPGSLQWVKTIPELGEKSPEYAILHSDPNTKLTMLMFRTPVAVHIKPHTHDLAETHVILVGGTHTFDAGGVRYSVQNGGFFRAPGGVVHEAWLPAGSQTLNILESGWVVNWLRGGPSKEDLEQYPPALPLPSAQYGEHRHD